MIEREGKKNSPYPLLLLFLSASPPPRARTLHPWLFRRTPLKKSTYEKEGALALSRVSLPPPPTPSLLSGERAEKISWSAGTARANPARKVKSFLSSRCGRSRQRLEAPRKAKGWQRVRLLARVVKRGKSFSQDFICDGGAICPGW